MYLGTLVPSHALLNLLHCHVHVNIMWSTPYYLLWFGQSHVSVLA